MKKTSPKKMKPSNSAPPVQDQAVNMVDEAIRQAEVRIAKGKRTGQGIGSVRMPVSAGKKK